MQKVLRGALLLQNHSSFARIPRRATQLAAYPLRSQLHLSLPAGVTPPSVLPSAGTQAGGRHFSFGSAR